MSNKRDQNKKLPNRCPKRIPPRIRAIPTPIIRPNKESVPFTAISIARSSTISLYSTKDNPKVYEKRRKPLLETLAKLGYKYDNGLLVKI